MFSLIITIISIALVAALALATLYYGGQAFNKGAADADASKLLLQGQQLIGAADLFRAREGRWPVDFDELVTEGYLKSVPVGAVTVRDAQAAENPWSMPVPSVPVFVLETVVRDTCKSVNQKMYGTPGILRTLRSAYFAQCYGGSDAALRVVVGRVEALAEAVQQPEGDYLGPVTAGPAPTDPGSPDWYVVPGASGGSGGAGSGGGGTGGDTGGEADPVTPPVASAPNLTVSPLQLDFDPLEAGENSSLAVTLSNTGGQPLTFAAAPQLTLNAEDYFSLDTTCGAVLAAGGQCQATVTFAPAYAGSFEANLRVYGQPADSPVDIPVTAEASGFFTLGITPASYTFPNVTAGTAQTRQFSVQSTGTADAVLSAPSLAATSASTMSIVADNGATPCNAGTVLAGGSACTVTVQYLPIQADDSSTGRLEIVAGASSVTANLAGVSNAPVLAAAPQTWAFGPINRSSSTTTAITVQNTGLGSLVFHQPAAMQPGTSSTLTVSARTCGTELAPGASCTLTVRYAPTTYSDASSGTLRVFGHKAGVFEDVALSGTSNAAPTTFDSSFKSSSVALSNGNLRASLTSLNGQWHNVAGTTRKLNSSGRYYFEITSDAASIAVGFMSPTCTGATNAGLPSCLGSYLVTSAGGAYQGGTNFATGPHTAAQGSVIGVSVDLTTKTMQYRVRTGSTCTAFHSFGARTLGDNGSSTATFVPVVSINDTGTGNYSANANFAGPFACGLPAGHSAW